MLNQIFSVLNRNQKIKLIILFFMIIIGSAMELVGVSAIMPLASIATDSSQINENELYIVIGGFLNLHSAEDFVFAFAIFLIGIYIIKNVYICALNYIMYKFTFNNRAKLSMQLLKYYINQDYLYHVSKNVADIQRNVSSDVGVFWDCIFAIMSLVNESMVCILLVFYLAVSDLASTMGISIILLLFLVFFNGVFKKYSVRLGSCIRDVVAEQNKWVLQTFSGIKEIKVSNLEDYFIDKCRASYEGYSRLQRKQSFITSVPKPVMESACICSLLLVLCIKILMGVNIGTFVPTLSVFVVAAFRMLPSFNRVSGFVGTIMYSKASIGNVYEDIERMNAMKHEQHEEKTNLFRFDMDNNICFNDVTFQYPEGEKPVIQDLSLCLEPKKSIAFIGASGSGKTTMADILLGVLRPQRGTITVGNVNIFEHLYSWHIRLGYIPQTIYLMDDSIRNNIAFGIENSDEGKIWEALREAQLEDFVKRLPQGLETNIGDRGVKLSGGQRQRIGIARALYKDPELLILDEATSALDNETESAVMQAIENLKGSRTMIIIAHRLTTIKNCDVIYEIKDGQAKEKSKQELFGEGTDL